MAKLYEAYPGYDYARNIGKVVMFQHQRWGILARQYVPGEIRTEKPKEYTSMVYEYINNKWNTLNTEEKQKYENLARKYFTTAYELFVSESMKELFGTKYKQGRYGCTRYGR
jgi:hypothetical protein